MKESLQIYFDYILDILGEGGLKPPFNLPNLDDEILL